MAAIFHMAANCGEFWEKTFSTFFNWEAFPFLASAKKGSKEKCLVFVTIEAETVEPAEPRKGYKVWLWNFYNEPQCLTALDKWKWQAKGKSKGKDGNGKGVWSLVTPWPPDFSPTAIA